MSGLIDSTGLTSAASAARAPWPGTIEQHWEAKGHRVQIEVVPLKVDERGGHPETIWVVRTDLRAGLQARPERHRNA